MLSTKIICTIGPSSNSYKMLERLYEAGMNIARLNMSHGDHESHSAVVQEIRKLNKTTKFPVAMMMDTQGPEIRTGNKEMNLIVGDVVHLIVPPSEENDDPKTLYVNYPHLPDAVKVGQLIAIDSGLINLKVLEKEGHSMRCEVVHGGHIKGRRHVNLPGVVVHLPSITEKDREDILFAKEMELDGIALSFVRGPEAIQEVREILGEEGRAIRLIAKIENQEGVDQLEEIVQEADGIMIARGDLGLETDLEELPQMQRKIAFACSKYGKPWVTATHLLESMIENPVPTRAEVTDVANAVYEQADAIMLSGETATGKHPEDSVKTLVSIAKRTEQFPGVGFAKKLVKTSNRQYLAEAATDIAYELGFKGFVVMTRYGRGARYLACTKPRGLPIYAFTNNLRTYRTLMFYRSVQPYMVSDIAINPEFTIVEALRILKMEENYQKGDQFMVLADILTGEGFVNSLQIRTIP